ncbi:MAG: site-specific integrase, partial [Thiohalophilus sp.]
MSNSTQDLIEQFLDALWMERGLSENTLAAYRSDLSQFGHWLKEQGSESLRCVRREQIQDYLAYRLEAKRSPR